MDTRQWWNKRRIRYNIGLAIAGLLAFICYVIVFTIKIDELPIEAAEITILSIFFQGMGYLFMMGIANIFYFLGPISEKLIKPKNVDLFREITFNLGFWFSILLSFSIPVSLLLLHRSG